MWSYAAGALRRGVVILGALALVAGCAGYQANRPDTAQRVQTMLSENEYAAALDTIALVKSSHPDYKRLAGWRETIEKNARAWEAGIIYDVEQMIEAGQWYNAEQQLDEGLRKLPQSVPLQQSRSRFLSKRSKHLAVINHQLIIARGRGLPAEIAALEKLAAVDPGDSELQEEVERRRTMLTEARRGLIDCGRAALAAGQTERALECLTIAQSIGRSREIDGLLAASRKTKTAEKQQVKAAAQKRVERDQARKIDELRGAYTRSLQNGDLNTARKHLDALLKLQPTAALRQESTRLDQRIQRRVERSLEDGRSLYTQGDFQGARAIWVSALRLDPGNQELKDNIARAERVLKKLKTLSDDQQTTN
jgi:tetratricopeptide (TPR) repeat protein